MWNDRMLKALSPHKDVLLVAINATQTLQESMTRIRAYPPSMLHLGRAMMGAALLQALGDADDAETVSLQWTAQGPFGGLFAEARGQGELRGTIDQTQVQGEDLAMRLGPGILQVRRTRPEAKMGSSGHVSAIGEESADLVEYLDQSEQKQCGLQMWVKINYDDRKDPDFPFVVERAVGFLVHILPSSSKNEFVSTLAGWDQVMRQLGPLSQWAWNSEVDPARQILQFLLAHPEPDIRTDTRIRFACTCSVDRAGRALALASRADPDGDREAQARSKVAVLKCEFCGAVYEIPVGPGPSA